jgi:hypothetical protein
MPFATARPQAAASELAPYNDPCSAGRWTPHASRMCSPDQSNRADLTCSYTRLLRGHGGFDQLDEAAGLQ